MKLKFAGLAIVALSVAAGSASAHHSYGMFDRQKEQKITGTVKEFAWTNPHSRLELVVPNTAGVNESWDIEMGPPGQLIRTGWKRTALKPGDKVSVLVNPLRDGKPGGHLLMVTTVGGQDLYDTVFKKPPTDADKK